MHRKLLLHLQNGSSSSPEALKYRIEFINPLQIISFKLTYLLAARTLRSSDRYAHF